MSSAALSTWHGQVQRVPSTGTGKVGCADTALLRVSLRPAVPPVPSPCAGPPASVLFIEAVPGSSWQQCNRFALIQSQRPHWSMMQNLLEPEFLSSDGSCVGKQVDAQTAVNTGMERNPYSPVPRARGDIQMPRSLQTPSLSHFLVISSLFRQGRCGQLWWAESNLAAPRWPRSTPAPKSSGPLKKAALSLGHKTSTEGPGLPQPCTWCHAAWARAA